MIKVLYKEDGTITDFWAINEIPSTPYIEISEELHLEISTKDNYIVQNGSIVDITKSQDYISKKEEETNQERKTEIKAQISNIELQQNRAIREILLNNNEYSKSKLQEIEMQIQELRLQL